MNTSCPLSAIENGFVVLHVWSCEGLSVCLLQLTCITPVSQFTTIKMFLEREWIDTHTGQVY